MTPSSNYIAAKGKILFLITAELYHSVILVRISCLNHVDMSTLFNIALRENQSSHAILVDASDLLMSCLLDGGINFKCV